MIKQLKNMELEITVISQELIKPSSPTPVTLRRHSLSFLDQLAPPIFMPFTFFYLRDPNLTNQQRCDKIKRSLSETLSLFYPLAGRVKDSGSSSSYVECNDEGVHFVEAKANREIAEILGRPNPNEVNKLLPFEFDEVSDVPLVVQLTFFECGGLALGIGMCHKVCDALSDLMFIRSFSAVARGDTNDVVVKPSFDLAKMFPPRDMAGLNMGTGITRENIVTRRFVFMNSSTESLREKFSGNDDDNIRATRVEALSVFIWTRFMASKGELANPTRNRKIYNLIHPVNLRRHADPPIPDNVFGNIMRFAVTIPQISEGNDEEVRNCLVKQIREEIKKIDAEYVKKLQEDSQEHLELMKRSTSDFISGEIVSFSFTSLCRFPVYEADFGWGKPTWVASARMSYKNLVSFLDTKNEDGVEAWINLEANDMAKLEADEEFISYVSPDPSVKISES